MADLTTISAQYQTRVAYLSTPSPGSTLLIAKADTRRWLLAFFARLGNDYSITTDQDPATGNFLDVTINAPLVMEYPKFGALCQLAWYAGASVSPVPVIVMELWKPSG